MEGEVKCKSTLSSCSPRGWQRGARGLSLRAASGSIFFPTSLKSGLGFIFVGNVCSLQPPDDRSSLSLELRHFILRFWNQILTWWERVRKTWAHQFTSDTHKGTIQKYVCGHQHTWESLSPSFVASFFLSGLLMYFCFWNIFSNAFRCTSEKTARRSIPLLGFPRAVRGHANVPGIGTAEDDTMRNNQTNSFKISVSLKISYKSFLRTGSSIWAWNESWALMFFKTKPYEWYGTRKLISTLLGSQKHWYGNKGEQSFRALQWKIEVLMKRGR